MASRYDNIRKVKFDDISRIGSSYLPKFKEQNSDILLIATQGDRCDLLAQEYYGDVNLWWIISRANRLDPSDLGLDVGTTLRIPVEVGEILGKLQEENR